MRSTPRSSMRAEGHLREQSEPITFHDLRHSFGSLAVQVYPVTDVQAFMGHEKIETTMRYVHHVPVHSDPTETNSAQLKVA